MPSTSRVLLAISAAVCLAAAPAREAAPQSAAQRLVAIGDLHGSAESLAAILQSAGLVDAGRKWIGGRARVVQTGDFLDRGAAVREVMDLLMRLEEEARRAGGRVDVLFGNHEGMNVLRDLRDVSPDAYAAFADAQSEARRSKAFIADSTIARRAGRELNRNDWLRDRPPGFLEYVEALGPSGRYGRWIRSRKVVAKVDDSIFMHAGIAPGSALTVDGVNRTAEDEVRAFDGAVATLERAELLAPGARLQEIVNAAAEELNRIAALLRDKKEIPSHVTQEYVARLQRLVTIDTWSLVAAEGPLWYRGYATLPDAAAPQIAELAARLRVGRFVVGHTPQLPGRIRARFDARVFLIDTGMLTTYYKGGRPSALEIAGGRVTAVYPDEREVLQGAPAPVR